MYSSRSCFNTRAMLVHERVSELQELSSVWSSRRVISVNFGLFELLEFLRAETVRTYATLYGYVDMYQDFEETSVLFYHTSDV